MSGANEKMEELNNEAIEQVSGGIETVDEDNESPEPALGEFNGPCPRGGVVSDVRKREHYEKPSVKRKKRAEAARKRKF